MARSQESVGDKLRNWNENGRLYLWGGTASAIISWIFLPLAGLFAVYSGYRLYDDEGRTATSALIAGFGGVGFLLWVVYLTTL